MSLETTPFLLLDCQTTGLTPSRGHLLEVAWCVLDRFGEPSREECHLVRLPEAAVLSSRIRSLTGIQDEDLVNASEKNAVRDRLVEVIGEAGVTHALVHYAQFERPFLNDLFSETGGFSLPILCTHQMAKRLHPHLPARSIRGLAGYYGWRTEELKRARHHLEATVAIWRGLRAELKRENLDELGVLEAWLAEKVKTERSRYQYPLPKEKRLGLPNGPGVYRMLGRSGEILYVGKATSLHARVNSYFRGRKGRDRFKLEMLTQVFDLRVTECRSPLEAALLETDEIKRHNPPYNISLKPRSDRFFFCSPDLRSVSSHQDPVHRAGPFRLGSSLEQLLLLGKGLEAGEIDKALFYLPLPIEDLQEGWRMFSERMGIRPDQKMGPRELLALGLRLYRRYQRRVFHEEAPDGEGVDRVDLADTDEIEAEAEMEARIEAEADDTIEMSLSIEEISEKFARLLMRSGKAWLRARTLTTLRNAQIRWQWPEGQACNLSFSGGHLSAEGSHPRLELQWRGDTVADYDRMSVLLSELIKVRSRGAIVEVKPMGTERALSEFIFPVEINKDIKI